MKITTVLVDDEPLARENLQNELRKIPFINHLASFKKASDTLAFLNEQKVDLLFSDIQMPDIDGLSLLQSLVNPPMVIFVTAHPQFAVQSFDLDVLDYMLKPISAERLNKAINKAVKAIELNKQGLLKTNYITIKDRHKTLLVEFAKIQYMEAMGDYIKIITDEKNHLVLQTMKEMERLLPPQTFLRVQKSYIINKNFVEGFTATKITLKSTSKTIPIGLNYRMELYRQLRS